jgi:predicted O-methyltransferase YrrM
MSKQAGFEQTLSDIDGIEGWLRPEQARVLWCAAKRLRPPARIVEIGSYRGRSAIVLARAARSGTEVVAIDPHAGNDRGPGQWEGSRAEGDADHAQFWSNLERAGVADRIIYVRSGSEEALATVEGAIELLYIDGAHRYGAVMADLDGWGTRVAPGGTMLIHDAFNSVGVTLALMRHMFLNRDFRYVGRCRSLAEYRREPVSGASYARSFARQIASLPWFVRNAAIRGLIEIGLRPLTRLLGYRDEGLY